MLGASKLPLRKGFALRAKRMTARSRRPAVRGPEGAQEKSRRRSGGIFEASADDQRLLN